MALEAIDEGFAPSDLLDIIFVVRLAAADGGLLARKVGWNNKVYAPYESRRVLEAAFSSPAVRRYSEGLHRGMLRALEPRLLSPPPERGYWRSPIPYFNLVHDSVRRRTSGLRSPGRILHRSRPSPGRTGVHGQRAWLEALRPQLLRGCLDRPSSAVWDVVDRSVFEQLMGEETPARREQYAGAIFDLITLVEYEAFRQAGALRSPFRARLPT
jgi:hypothetical protein